MCTCAGVLPGFSGIIAEYFTKIMDSINSLEIFFIFQDKLSYISAKDMLIETIKGNIEIYQEGCWKKVNIIKNLKSGSFYDSFGKKLCVPVKFFEIENFPKAKLIKNFGFYLGVGSFLMEIIIILFWMIIRKFTSDKLINFTAKILQILSNLTTHSKVKGFAIRGIARGTVNDKKTILTIESGFNNIYAGTGIVAATIAQMILTGEINKCGAFYLNECVEPAVFLKHVAGRRLKCTLKKKILTEEI
jgi:saccharopine dehydrogenase-like NADP-dependent oxidoreductase